MSEEAKKDTGKIGPLDKAALIVIIKNLRRAMNLRQIDLASNVGVTDRTIKAIEKGEKSVRPYHLELVCRALGFELIQEMQYTLIPIKIISNQNADSSV